MSDTPRTDKEQGRAGEWLHSDMVVPAGFARLLERESRKYKNIARETLDQMGRDTESAIKSADEMELLKKQLNVINTENDKLNAEVERLKERGASLVREICGKDDLIEQMREALSWQCAACPDTNDYGDKRHCDECSVKRLLAAAERTEK